MSVRYAGGYLWVLACGGSPRKKAMVASLDFTDMQSSVPCVVPTNSTYMIQTIEDVMPGTDPRFIKMDHSHVGGTGALVIQPLTIADEGLT